MQGISIQSVHSIQSVNRDTQYAAGKGGKYLVEVQSSETFKVMRLSQVRRLAQRPELDEHGCSSEQ